MVQLRKRWGGLAHDNSDGQAALEWYHRAQDKLGEQRVLEFLPCEQKWHLTW